MKMEHLLIDLLSLFHLLAHFVDVLTSSYDTITFSPYQNAQLTEMELMSFNQLSRWNPFLVSHGSVRTVL